MEKILEEKSPLISVIIPIYNVEQYLNRGIESIVNQTYKNLEIILVDDGSTDNCHEICEEWEKKDNRISVIHQRNTGLKNAKGEYIYFFDPDDFIEVNLIEILLKEIIKDKIDIVICNYYIEKNNKTTIKMNIKSMKINKKKLYNMIIQKQYFCGYVWNKLYKHSIISENNLCFNENVTMNEDLLFNCEYIQKIKESAYYISKPLYHYYIRENSLLNEKSFSEKRMLVYNALDRLMEIFNEESKENIIYLKERYIKTTYMNLYLLKKNNIDEEIIYNQIEKSKKYKNEIINKLDSRKKFEICFITKCPLLYGKIKDKIKKE